MPPRKFTVHLSRNAQRGVIIDSDSDAVVLEFDNEGATTDTFISSLVELMNDNADDLPRSI